MGALYSFFIGQPLIQLVIGGLFFVGYFLASRNPNLPAKTLLTPALLWLAWGVWEWVIMQMSPGANIRVDLLIILPVVLIVSIVTVVVLFRTPKTNSSDG